MSYIVLDFESYYDKDYSLRKMTPVEYILDPRFECFGAAIAEGDTGPARWYDCAPLRDYLKGKRAEQKLGKKLVVVSQNALFDMCLLAWRFGVVPDLMIDTMGMSRALVFHKTGSVSLETVANHLGIGVKGNTIKHVSGLDAAAIAAAGLWDDFTAYATHDAELCRRIFQKLRPQFPPEEFLVQDMVLRCAITPRFKLDAALLAEHAHQIEVDKQSLLDRCGITKPELMSNDKFAEALRRLGVEPPRKVSPVTGRETWAFAKTDQAMAELEEDPNPDVQALVAARLGFKSTIEETRTARFQAIARLTWPGNLGDGWMPIPLRYSGAHTHRLSGDWKLNLQNLNRGGKLRRALVAPPGYTVVTCDAAQIEARIVAWLAGATELVEAFAQGRDVYSEFATRVYGYPVNKKEHPAERFTGKTGVLGLGFGVGHVKFRDAVKTGSRLQLGREIDLGAEFAQVVVNSYRLELAPQVPAVWKFLQNAIPMLARGFAVPDLGPVKFEPQAILLPSGLRLFYPDLRQEVTDKGTEWVCTYGKKPKRIYGGKLYENIVQALARIIVLDAALRIRKRFPKIPLAHQVHDELVYVPPRAAAAELKQALLEEMSTPPDWALGLPLAAEAGEGPSYGDAK